MSSISLDIRRGEVFGFIGHSGAGKSSLIRLINGLESATSGTVTVDGEAVGRLDATALRVLRRRIGMIFQHFNLLSSQRVRDNVAFPLRLAGLPEQQIKARVSELLARVGLESHADAFPAQLSGGQKQRVGIARALATQPSILLCDEATSALDPQTTASVLDLLAELNRELGLTIVLITHEMEVIRRICDRVAVLDQGRIVETGPVSEVFLNPQHPTTRRFVQESEPSPEAGIASNATAHAGRIVRITVLGADVDQPLLSEVVKHTGVDVSVLSGRVHRIKDVPYSQLVLKVSGQQVDAALQQLAALGARVEEVGA
ncbi:ATP-binding cassette domain-containing protein [Pseudoxanthomonas sp.]|uniref:methionine ABC transporter ATP-binding protein n=1 Tax=Pseudoxanthomonas sp. TaxID=1871049 RepID=UPI0026192EB1|nr:ATP-binding cassette domain-containing protein [Pseudoxanthomonas sp.]WDS38138.1 MAG: ATP-binding cassette domain-containing protein [Pseudoxanthomonas sp.]